MSENELGRIKGDLATLRRAIGLHLTFGKEILIFGLLLTFVAVSAAVFSLLVEDGRLQLSPLAAILVFVPIGVYLQSRRNANLSPEVILQELLSICIYAIVWVAACGYSLATFLGPTVGAARTVALNTISVGLLLAFTVILVRSALRSRERYYCLGLAISTLLAGMLLPVFDPHYCFPLAHCFMAVGCLTNVAIQRAQLREAVANHAAD